MGAINFLLSTGSLGHFGLARVFELARTLDFDGVEVIIDWRADTRQGKYLQRLQREFMLSIPVIHAPFVANSYPVSDGDWSERLVLSREVATAVKARLVVAHPPLLGEPDIDLNSLNLATGVPVVFETMPKKTRKLLGLSFKKNIWRYGQPRNWADFDRLAFDTCHIGSWELDLFESWRLHRKQVAHIHLSNLDGTTFHTAPADGQLDLRQFLITIARNGYRGSVTLELAPHSAGGYDLAASRKILNRSLTFCRQSVVKAFARKRSYRR